MNKSTGASYHYDETSIYVCKSDGLFDLLFITHGEPYNILLEPEHLNGLIDLLKNSRDYIVEVQK